MYGHNSLLLYDGVFIRYCADLGANHEEDEACWVKVDTLDVYPTLLSLEYV